MRKFCFLCTILSVSVFAKEQRALQERYDAMVSFYHEENWDQVIEEGKSILEDSSDAALGIESNYYLGVAFFHSGDFDLSNRYFSKYVKDSSNPSFFEKTLSYKFLIAENFRLGAKKHVVQWEKSPQWLPAQEDALQIYEEIISSYPYDELGIKALYGKGLIHKKRGDYSKSIDAFQILLQRFPYHELAIESFLEIGDIYVKRCEEEHLDPSWLDLAEMNLRKFVEVFPGEKRVLEAKAGILRVKEAFAKNLYETAKFYERTKKPQAAVLYYAKILSQFPDTQMAQKADERIQEIQTKGS